MNIKVVGAGCANCKKLLENVKTAVKETGIDASIEYITDFVKIAALNIMRTPAVIIDDKIVSMGKVLSVDEVRTLVSK